MSKKVVITGVNGFVGEHVVDVFIASGFEVVGVGHDNTPNDKVVSKIAHYEACDLLDMESVATIDFSSADTVIHLAGLSNVGDSFNRPLAYINDNSTMTYNLLEQARLQGFKGRFIVVSSGALYDSNQPLPLNEESPSLENSPYAVGKLAVEHVGNYFRLRGLDVVIARPFNHIGPGQAQGFLVPDLFAQLHIAKQNGADSISVGNLATRRDYTDVRDIAYAYKLLATTPHLAYGLYNICTGRSLAGSEILQVIQQVTGITNISPVIDQSKVRPTDIMEIYGDASRLRQDTGWQPEIKIDQTIKDFVNAQA